MSATDDHEHDEHHARPHYHVIDIEHAPYDRDHIIYLDEPCDDDHAPRDDDLIVLTRADYDDLRGLHTRDGGDGPPDNWADAFDKWTRAYDDLVAFDHRHDLHRSGHPPADR